MIVPADNFQDCALLITEGLPNGTQLGIDFQSYCVGDQFHGIQMIPPGPHFVFWAPRDSSGETSIRMGFFHYFVKGEIHVREWNHELEELKERKISEIEKNQIFQHFEEYESCFASYEISLYTKWKNLTNKITRATLMTLNPEVGIVRPFGELISNPEFDRSNYNSNKILNPSKQRGKLDFLQLEDLSFPYLDIVKETIPKFIKVPERCPSNLSSAEITKHYMDCIDSVDELFLEIRSNDDDLISEIQYAFSIFLCCHSIEGLLHWRKILLILSNSESAISKYYEFYKKYYEILKFQIQELPEELMSPNPRNMVYQDIKKLIINSIGIFSIKNELNDFLKCLQSNMKWFLGDELVDDEDDLPVIVDL